MTASQCLIIQVIVQSSGAESPRTASLPSISTTICNWWIFKSEPLSGFSAFTKGSQREK
jgi:hypothetical protein